MQSITIEIPTNFDKRIVECLESIRTQTFQDFETIVVATDRNVKELVEGFDVKLLVAPFPGTLIRRIMAHDIAKGDKALLFEASRQLDKGALDVLNRDSHHMLIIEEKDIGNSPIARIQNIERHLNLINIKQPSPASLIAEPRLYNSRILKQVYEKIRNIDKNVLARLQFGDLDIIYYESYLISNDLGVIKQPLIYHYTDQTLFQLATKYYNYGRSNKVLKLTPYGGIFKSSNHLRPYYGLKNSFLVYSVMLVKAISFFSGMYLTNGLPDE